MSVFYENRNSLITVLEAEALTPLPHIHKEIEIIYIYSGTGEMFADKAHFHAEAGDLFIAFPNQVHYYKNNAPGEFLIIIGNPITLSGLETVFTKSIPENNVIHTASNENISAYIEEMKNADGKYALTKLCGYFNLLMSAVIPNLQLKPQLQTAHSTLSKILDYCNKSFKDEITLDDVSQKLHLSKYYISHIINKELNLRFSDYINSLRISAACDMLKETDAKIADVSEDIGFGTIRSFNRIFKDHMNITPGEYRRIFKEK